MILVDTSVLIGYLRGENSPVSGRFDACIDQGISYGINSFIYQELLQGAKDHAEFKLLDEYLGSLPFYDLRHGQDSFKEAALLYYRCRKKGITVRSSLDMLIARAAVENDVYLLHNDSDFDRIGRVEKKLKMF